MAKKKKRKLKKLKRRKAKKRKKKLKRKKKSKITKNSQSTELIFKVPKKWSNKAYVNKIASLKSFYLPNRRKIILKERQKCQNLKK